MWYGLACGRAKDDRFERVCQKLIVIKQTSQEIKFIFISIMGFNRINAVAYQQFTLCISMVYFPLY